MHVLLKDYVIESFISQFLIEGIVSRSEVSLEKREDFMFTLFYGLDKRPDSAFMMVADLFYGERWQMNLKIEFEVFAEGHAMHKVLNNPSREVVAAFE